MFCVFGVELSDKMVSILTVVVLREAIAAALARGMLIDSEEKQSHPSVLQ